MEKETTSNNNQNSEPTVSSEKVNLLLDKIKDLPTLPSTAARIIEIINKLDSSAKVLAEIISNDQTLASKLLKIANSSFYGFSGSINSIREAIVLIGFEELINLALSISVFSSFFVRSEGAYFNRLKFWDHCSLCAFTCRLLVHRKYYEDPQRICFLAGLLHDLGRVVLDRYFPKEFGEILHLIDHEGIDSSTAESKILGINHAEVGAELLKRWQLPLPLTEVIKYHHCPWEAPQDCKDLASAVLISDYICKFLGYGAYVEETQWNSLEDLMESYALKKLKAENLLPKQKNLEEVVDYIKENFSASNGINI